MTLEEKTSFWLENGVHLETEVIIKGEVEEDHYKVHTCEDCKRGYVVEGYENNELLGRHLPLTMNLSREERYCILTDALYLHFDVVEYLRKGEVNKFKEFFTKPPEASFGIRKI